MPKDVPDSSADRRPVVGRSLADRQRSRVTNHQDLLPDLDGRSSAARRFRDLVSAFVQDAAGLDNCSEIKLGLIRRLAACTVRAEMLEAEMMAGKPVCVAELCSLASTALRLSSRLGLERVPRDVGPTLAEYLESLQAKSEPEAAEADDEEAENDD